MSDETRISALATFYSSAGGQLPAWLDDHVTAEDGCPTVSIGTGTNQEKTANILKYEMSDINGWENANITSGAPKPQYNANDLIWAAASGSQVKVWYSGGTAYLSVSDALDCAEGFGINNDNYIKNNVEYDPDEMPPPPPGGGN